VKTSSLRVVFVATLLTLILGACAPATRTVPAEPPADAPADFPYEQYRLAEKQGAPVYRIDAITSRAVVRVSRSGPLARFGHDHVVASHDIQGFVQLTAGTQDLTNARADLWLPLATLTVDEPELREAAGFTSEPSASDIEGTRANMLKSLEADRYPYLTLSATVATAEVLNIDLTLHGVQKNYAVPAAISLDGDTLQVIGTFTLQQSDHDITPFSALGGAMSVGDALEVEFHLNAYQQ
jgi:hypothetical protein